MREIKIFLGSSIVPFQTERMDIENFIYRTSHEIFERVGIEIVPLLRDCDTKSHSNLLSSVDGKMIADSDMCFFVFFDTLDMIKEVEKEFDLAFKKFSETQKPKIYVYFKTVNIESLNSGIKTFMEKIDKALGHYHSEFDSIDTVKLRIALNLAVMSMDYTPIDIGIEDGYCVVDGKKVISVENVNEFANNSDLTQMYNELREVEKEYYEYKARYDKEKGDDEFYQRYSKLAAKRENLKEAINKLEKAIFNVSLRLCKDEATGKEITIRQKKAYKLFEQGDYEGCLRVLDAKEMDDEYFMQQNKSKQEMKRRAEVFIRENRTLIYILPSVIKYENRFKYMAERYEVIAKEAEEYLVELDVIREYASFLDDQGKTTNAYEVAKRLERIYVEHPEVAEEIDRFWLCNLVGGILSDIPSKHIDAEKYYLKAIELAEKIVAEKTDRYKYALATSYNNAGIFYHDHGKANQAETYYQKAIEIREQLAKENPDRYNGVLASSYNNAGLFYSDQGKSNQAETYYQKAIGIREQLAKEKPDRYNGDLAMSYNNAGILYKNQGKLNQAETYYLKAIRLFEQLAKENPDRYNGDLAASYDNAGVFYDGHGKSNQAETYHQKAIELYEHLAKENPDRYNGGLAMSCHNFAICCALQYNLRKAENYAKRAVEIYRELAKANPARYSSDLQYSLELMELIINT